MPENTVKVDRTTKWGNPFIVGKHGTRERCVELYAYLMAGYLCLDNNCAEQQDARDHVAKNRSKLRGKNLACWCPLNAKCHADILLEIANPEQAA
jgi:hypothetical protein